MHDNDEAQIRQFAQDASKASRDEKRSDSQRAGMIMLLGKCTEVIARRVFGIDTSKYVKDSE